MNLPNKLTLSRIGLAFVFMFFLLFTKGLVAKYLALFTFSLACLTDLLDGRIARARNLENDFGRMMDPIADKVLILSAFIAFVEMKIIYGWMVIIIIFRELIVTGLRVIAVSRGRVISASLAGKHKTASQMVAIISILIFLIIKESFANVWNVVWELWFRRATLCLMWITVILTLISGLSYLVRNRKILFVTNREELN